jgi:hypothetical protein
VSQDVILSLKAVFSSIRAPTDSAEEPFFYWLSGKDLNREANELRRLNVLIIRALAHAGLADVNFEDEENPTGLVFKVHAFSRSHVGGSASASVQQTAPSTVGSTTDGCAIPELIRDDQTKNEPAD